MKKILSFAMAFALFASTQAFAIVGVGAHYVMNLGSSLKSSEGPITLQGESFPDLSIRMEQEGADGLQGLGFKVWLDFLPVVDIEGTFNVAAVRYNSTLYVTRPTVTSGGELSTAIETIPFVYAPEAPYNMAFEKASPIYGVFTGDISITKPFVDLPIIRPYIGAGVSYFASIPIVNRSFTQSVIDGIPSPDPNQLQDVDAGFAKGIGDAVVKTLKKESYKSGIGGHGIIGFRLKAPIIPFAIYANGKYYFGGNIDDQFTQGFVVEIGGGLAL
jgi:hypothetical protein